MKAVGGAISSAENMHGAQRETHEAKRGYVPGSLL